MEKMDWLADVWLYPQRPLLTPLHILQTGLGMISYPGQPQPLVLLMSVPVFNVASAQGDADGRALMLIGAGAAWYFTNSYLAFYAGGAAGKMLWQWRGGAKEPMSDAQ